MGGVVTRLGSALRELRQSGTDFIDDKSESGCQTFRHAILSAI
jgi:hypothetical protein